MRRLAAMALLVFAVAGCDGDPAPTTAAPSSSAPAVPPEDAVFTTTMDGTSPGWRADFAVEGTEGSEPEQLAILAAQTACSRLESMPIEDVLLSFLSGALPSDTVGSMVYAATVAYCPEYTQAVQNYGDTNR